MNDLDFYNPYETEEDDEKAEAARVDAAIDRAENEKWKRDNASDFEKH